MFGVLSAERAVFGKNQSVRIVLLVLNTVIVTLLAFGAFERDFVSRGLNCHNKTPCKKITPPRCVNKVYHIQGVLSIFFEFVLKAFLFFYKIFFTGNS